MPKKTTILIVILALITGVLIFLAIRSDKTLNLGKNNQEELLPTKVQPYANLSFSKPIIDATGTTTTQSVDIILDTSANSVAGTQVELSYDSNAVSNVVLAAPSAGLFGEKATILINTVDPTQGRISYAVGISLDEEEKVGRGAIATLSFTVNKQAGIPKTSITFLPKSAVTSLNTQGSVLSSTSPLQIQILPTAK